MTRSRYWGHRGGAEHRGQTGSHPISIRAIERAPIRRRLEARGYPYLRPNRPQSDEEGPVHQTFQVSSEPHPRIRELLFDESNNEPKQEQKDAVPKELAFSIQHGYGFCIAWVSIWCCVW